MNKTNDTGKIGFWTGNPSVDTAKKYYKDLGVNDHESFADIMNDDCRWIMPEEFMKTPDGFGINTKSDDAPPNCGMNEYCRFANAKTVADIDAYKMPDPRDVDFTPVYEELDKHQDKGVFTGMWTCFFHITADFFGMEEYFMRMYTDPDLVMYVTDKVVDYYAEANELFMRNLGDRADTIFYGNDFGSQLCSLMSPKMFNKFIRPGLEKNIAIAKKYNKKVMLHSCGSVANLIPYFIDMGVDALHPLQAKAAMMSAEDLSREFKGKISFLGGIDTQDLLVNGSPDDIKEDVKRVVDLLRPNLIVSPSHECILPNIPLENMLAIRDTLEEINGS